jgi:hypothetical protein
MSAITSAQLKKLRRNAFLLGTGFIIIIWSLLYLPNLRTAPSWYGDEILTLDIGKALTRGELANRAVYCTFFSPTYNYQPEFAFLTGIFSRITGGDILGGRFFSAIIGLLTGLTGFYLIGRKLGVLWGVFFALVLLGYSQAIIHYRWIYPHDAVGLGVLGAVLLLMRPASSRTDWKAGGFLAIAAGSHLLVIHATFTALLCRIKRPRSWIPIGLPPAFVLTASALLVWSFFHGWLFQDLHALGDIYSRYSAENGGGIRKLLNFTNFFLQDPFHILAFVGCLLCLRRRTYVIAIFAFLLTFLLTQNRQNLPLFYYQAMIVFPTLVAGITFGLHFLVSRILVISKSFYSARRLLPALLLLAALLNCLTSLPAVFSGNIITRVSPWVVSSTKDYDIAAEWINSHTTPDDLVIVYWTLGWQLHCRTADVLTATAWSGLPAGDYYPTPPEHARFRWDADFAKAKYFVLSDLDQRWALAQGQALDAVRQAGIAKWPVIYTCGSTSVFENPRFLVAPDTKDNPSK